MKLHGILLKESLADDSALDLVEVVGVTMAKHQNTVPPQPKWWTEVRFEADAARAEEIANRFGAALKRPGWYLHYWTDTDVFIVFPGKFFKYAKAARAIRERLSLTVFRSAYQGINSIGKSTSTSLGFVVSVRNSHFLRALDTSDVRALPRAGRICHYGC